MLQLADIQFHEERDGAIIVIAGQLTITKAGSMNTSRLTPEQAAIVKGALRVRIAGWIWNEAYDGLATAARAVLAAAREGGDLRTIGAAADLLEHFQQGGPISTVITNAPENTHDQQSTES